MAKVMVRLGEKMAGLTGKPSALMVQGLEESLAERWFDCGRAKEVLGYEPEAKIADALKEAAENRKME
jgi:sterol-4alpha-carboxylate 3-dehydrogenase (decarboxylating)